MFWSAQLVHTTTLQLKKLKILALCVLYICACGRISEKGDRGKQNTCVKDLEGQVWLQQPGLKCGDPWK